MKKTLVVLFLLIFGSFIYADETAASLSQADIQTAVDAAGDGDTVNLPAGTNTTFSGTVTVSTNNLIIKGAGKTSTIIELGADADARSAPMFLIDNADGVEFCDMELEGWNTATSWSGCIHFDDCTDFNVHDCKFEHGAYFGIRISGYPADGVIWNCDIVNCFRPSPGTGLGYGVMVSGIQDGETTTHEGDASWDAALALGTSDGVYIENCTFSFCRHYIAANHGARYIARHNTVNANYDSTARVFDAHGRDLEGRGTRKVELYNNTVTFPDPPGVQDWFMIANSAAGVIYDNIFNNMKENDNLLILSHTCCDSGNCREAFVIQMTDGGETCTMTITGDPATALTTDASGAVTDFNLDLTHADYNTFKEVIDHIALDANYTCTESANWNDNEDTSTLSDINAQDIQSGSYIVQSDDPIPDKSGPWYLWGNENDAVSYNTPAPKTACNDEIGQPYWVADTDWFESEMGGYSAYTYPHPLRGSPTEGNIKGTTNVKGTLIIKGDENGHSYIYDDEAEEWIEARRPGMEELSDSFSLVGGGAYPNDFTWLSADDSNSAVTSVKNQFTETPPGGTECSVCWAFATVAALESQIMLPSSGAVGNPSASFDLAEEFLKECRTDGGSGCNNSTMHMGLGILSTQGIPLESCDQFVWANSSPCNPNNCAEKYVVTGYRWVGSTEATIKQALYDYGPLLTTMDTVFDYNAVPDSFVYDYDGTCVASTSDTANNHVVIIVGYTDTATNSLTTCDASASADQWIIKQSFGTGWGDSGYGYIDIANDANVGVGTWRISDWEIWDESRIIHHYDESGWGSQRGDTTTYYGLAKYTATADQTAVAIGFYLPSNESVTYTIYLYDAFDGTDLGNLLTSQGATVQAGGLNTVYLNTPQDFNKDDDIVAVLKLVYSSYSTPIATDDDSTLNETAKTYISPSAGSGTWTDVGDTYGEDVCLRVIADIEGASIRGTTSIKGTVIIKGEQ